MDGTIADNDGCSRRAGGSREAAFENKDGWMIVMATEDWFY